jgi:hypothetical protein
MSRLPSEDRDWTPPHVSESSKDRKCCKTGERPIKQASRRIPAQSRKSKQRLPDIGFQRDWYCPAQKHHEEYDAVSHAGNVQVSKLHIEDAAKGQEEENQQNVVPQSLERGVIHGRSRMRREGEWRVAV